MADQILDQIRDLAEGQIDFEGQRLAEFLTTTLLVIVGAVAFFAGLSLQDIKLSLYLGLGGTALTFALVVPPWPFFKRRPVKWLPVAGNNVASQPIVVDGHVVG